MGIATTVKNIERIMSNGRCNGSLRKYGYTQTDRQTDRQIRGNRRVAGTS